MKIFTNTVTGHLAAGMVEARYKLAWHTARIFLMEGTEQSLQNLEDAFTDLRDIARIPAKTGTPRNIYFDRSNDIARQLYGCAALILCFEPSSNSKPNRPCMLCTPICVPI